jgi:hypothetical protein
MEAGAESPRRAPQTSSIKEKTMRKKLIILGFALAAAAASTLTPASASGPTTVCPFFPYHLVVCPDRVICCPNDRMCDCA